MLSLARYTGVYLRLTPKELETMFEKAEKDIVEGRVQLPTPKRCVAVCGGRDYDNESEVIRVLSAIHEQQPIGVIVHGDCTGADALAKKWADGHGVKQIPVPADWDTHGKAAGPIRNAEIIERHQPNLLVAFEGGRGTSDMMDRARAARITIIGPIPRNGDELSDNALFGDLRRRLQAAIRDRIVADRNYAPARWCVELSRADSATLRERWNELQGRTIGMIEESRFSGIPIALDCETTRVVEVEASE